MSKGDLIRRLAVAVVGIPLALVVLFAGGWLLTLFVAFLAALATRELDRFASSRGIGTFPWVAILGTIVLVLLAGWTRSFQLWAPWALGTLLACLFLCSGAALKFRTPEDRPLLGVSVSSVGIFYWGGCFSFAVFLRHLPDGTGWPEANVFPPGPLLLAFPLAVTWTSDTAAYLLGSLLGRRKLAPSVSPGKTIEGAAGGLLAAALVGVVAGGVFISLASSPTASALVGGGLGALMGIVVQVGDLIESLFKREAGMKDSGSLLPGHGGVLDRFDGLIFTLPLIYFLLSALKAQS